MCSSDLISQRNGVETFLYTRNYIRENYPVEYGVWKINSQLISCGTTKNIPEKQATVDDPFDAINVTLNNITVGNSCNSVAIVRNTVYSTFKYSPNALESVFFYSFSTF